MKIKSIFAILALSFIVSGCGLTSLTQSVDDEGYRKVSLTLDVVVGSDGSISRGACFGNGTIASVLYFPYQGGEVVSQRSTLTVNGVPCLDCYSEITDTIKTFEIELSAVLEPSSVAVSIGDEEVPSKMKDELRFWIEKIPTNELNIYYECGGAPDTLPDYGSTVAQIASPFIISVWTQDLELNEVKTSTFEDYAFLPTYLADITISTIEALTDTTNE